MFDFEWLPQFYEKLLGGALVTLLLITVGSALGLAISVGAAWARTIGPKPIRFAVASYVELVRNTPFLIQLFFIFFGLPQIGLKMTDGMAAIVAMSLNLGAYGSEIIRAGVQSTARGQWEAAGCLGMSPNQTFFHVVLLPSVQKIWPALSGQIVIVMLGSAVVSQISVEELTFAANYIQSRTYRAFEVYFVATVLYVAISALVRAALYAIGRKALGIRVRP